MLSAKQKEQIVSSLKDKEYRDAVVEQGIQETLPLKIYAMRQERGWSQAELAERVGMTQTAISRLENPNYGRFSLATLLRLASAFDVALDVDFVAFSTLVDRMAALSREQVYVPGYEQDLGRMSANDAGTLAPVPGGPLPEEAAAGAAPNGQTPVLANPARGAVGSI